MIKSDDEHVLFIEPKRGASKEPVQDELTAEFEYEGVGNTWQKL